MTNKKVAACLTLAFVLAVPIALRVFELGQRQAWLPIDKLMLSSLAVLALLSAAVAVVLLLKHPRRLSSWLESV